MKPGNVLVTPEGRVRLTDFGIATAMLAADELGDDGVLLGTAKYVAPEQVQGQMTQFKTYLRPGAAPGLQMATFLKELEGIAKNNEIESLDIKPQEGEGNDLYQTYVFDVQALCDYPRWIRFLHAVESSQSLFEVQRARLGVKEGEGEGTLDVYLRLTAIAFNEPASTKP